MFTYSVMNNVQGQKCGYGGAWSASERWGRGAAGRDCPPPCDRVGCRGGAGQGTEVSKGVEELLRTNDLVLISFVEALLRDAGIESLVVDGHMSVVEGTLGVLPRRVLVAEGDIAAARDLLESAGIGAELAAPKGSKVEWP